MKANQAKKALTFGEFIMAAYDAWGKQRARGVVWLAMSAHLVRTWSSFADNNAL
jgi:hypothetical protein